LKNTAKFNWLKTTHLVCTGIKNLTTVHLYILSLWYPWKNCYTKRIHKENSSNFITLKLYFSFVWHKPDHVPINHCKIGQVFLQSCHKHEIYNPLDMPCFTFHSSSQKPSFHKRKLKTPSLLQSFHINIQQAGCSGKILHWARIMNLPCRALEWQLIRV